MEHRGGEEVSRASGSALGRLTALLGDDVFLVPCEYGTKKPLVTYVERPFESTKTEAYRALFQVQDVNIAVYLGKASGGLCAIDFDREEDLAAFLAVNPKLAQTTRSRGRRGGMVWVRIVQNAECRVQNEELARPSPERRGNWLITLKAAIRRVSRTGSIWQGAF